MKVVVYKDALLGRRGADFAVCETLRLLVRAGHEIVLFLGQSESIPRCEAVPAKVKTRFLPKPKKTFLSKLGITKPFQKYAQTLVSAIDTEKPDVIIAAGTNELLDLVSFAVKPKAPIVMQLHTDPRHMMKRRQKVRNKKLQEAFKALAATQVLCEAFVPMLEELVPATKGKVVAIGNACRWLEECTQSGGVLSPKAPPYILYPAAFTREKNQILLIESFAKVANAFPDWQLHLYGTGSADVIDACKVRVVELGLKDRVLFKGFAKDLKPAYADCAFVATPSVSEGFGLIVIEAAAFRRPTLALAEVPSLASLVKDGETGRLATRETFADALRDLMADADKRRTFGEMAFAAVQVFSPAAIQAAWCDLLRRVRDANPNLAAVVSDVDSLLLLGEGSRRRCFELPGSAYCVKFYRLENEFVARTLPSVRREIKKLRHSRKGNTCCQEYDYWVKLKETLPPDLFAAFPERMELIHHDDRGWGVVESRFRNFDGSDLKPIAVELKTLKDNELKKGLVRAFEELCEELANHAVKFYDPPNVLVEWLAEGTFKLRIADFEPANRVLIPLFTNTKIYIRLRVRRRARRYAQLLRWLLPCPEEDK